MINRHLVGRPHFWFALLTGIVLISGCSILQAPPPQAFTYNLPPAPSGILAQASERFEVSFGKETSGFLLLENNQEAMNWRLALIDHAQTSIDAQYFIWQDDAAGNLLFSRLLQAADRGVRVRLLVDDIFLAARDSTIAMISRHPNFKIKIYNPGRVRDSTLGGLGEFLLYFRELNRRMHNKLLVVDNRTGVVGGRNIGNQYFGLGSKYNFLDLDVLVLGAVIPEISWAFDEYWNAELSYPGEAMGSGGSAEEEARLRTGLQETLRQAADQLSAYPSHRKDWSAWIKGLLSEVKTGEAHFLQDEPVRIGEEEVRLLDMLNYLSEPNHKELMVVSPYLIPSRKALNNLQRLTSEGVEVKVMTGSMGANNHTAAHSHYKKYRHPLLNAGAFLFELRHDPSSQVREDTDVPLGRSKFICLHIKAMVGDRTRSFIGSLNFDPRAVDINTENGLLIESQPLSQELAAHLDELMGPANSWRVYHNEEGWLRWSSDKGTVSKQPARSFGQRFADFFFRLLPIENQL